MKNKNSFARAKEQSFLPKADKEELGFFPIISIKKCQLDFLNETVLLGCC